MPHRYPYVGPPAIADVARQNTHRVRVSSPADVRAWIADSLPDRPATSNVTATFVVDSDKRLWIADRRSEHVACSRGGAVFSAGEMTFGISANDLEVVHVTNQSTGFCPRPDSWPAVAAALDNAGIGHPGEFSERFEFRRCVCGQINLVKDEVYECGVCGADLPPEWNVAPVYTS